MIICQRYTIFGMLVPVPTVNENYGKSRILNDIATCWFASDPEVEVRPDAKE